MDLPDASTWTFILGCQRSGTTLLRMVLECHPEFFCFDEIDSYNVLRTRRCDVEIDARYTVFKIPRYTEQIDASVLHDYEEPDVQGPIYRRQPILFLVRNWQDTVVSMQTLTGWLHFPHHIIADKIASSPGFAKQFAREIELWKDDGGSDLATCALYWTYKTAALFRYAAAGYPLLPIAYEALTAHPDAEIRRVCDFLQVQFHASMLNHAELPHREILPSGLAVGGTNPRRSIDQRSVGRWSDFAGGGDWDQARRIVGDLPARVLEMIQKQHLDRIFPSSM